MKNERMWEVLPGAMPGDKSELTELEVETLARLRAQPRRLSGVVAQPERYKGEVLPVGIRHAERVAAERTMSRKRDAEPVQGTMFSECSEQVSLF